jgi:predicted nucleic acid-binding protein
MTPVRSCQDVARNRKSAPAWPFLQGVLPRPKPKSPTVRLRGLGKGTWGHRAKIDAYIESCAMNGNALKLRRVIEKHKIIGLDTAPFIYYMEDVTPYADLLDPVFTLLENHALSAVTSTVTFAEILTKPFADKSFPLADEIKFTIKSFSSLFVVSIDEKLAETAALIRARYTIRLPDALQLAAAIQEEATLFLTNDKRVKRLDAIQVLILSDFLP